MQPSRRILLVEDDPGIRDSVAECLVSIGYDVAEAANGDEGLAWLRREGQPAVILVDLVMPVMNGAEFLERIRADPAMRAVPVVLMTAAMPTSATPLPKADSVLTKPFELEDLLDAIERHCRSAA